jgi:plastocyanin
MWQKLTFLGIFLALVVALISCSGPSYGSTPTQTTPSSQTPSTSAASGQFSVTISNFAFNPQTLNVPRGSTVTWTNKDSTSHTVTSDSGLFDGGPLSSGAVFSFTFNQAGTFSYHCSIHPNMKATIVVQ